jgi:hypothetical protein
MLLLETRLPLSRQRRRCAPGLDPATLDRPTIRQAVREASPNLEERKRGHVEDSVQRTVDVAFQERQRGRGRRERDEIER